MNAYLLDTSILSAYLDGSHKNHILTRQVVDGLPGGSPRYVSAIALAELTFGVELPVALGRGDLPSLRKVIADAHAFGAIGLSHHTATAYGQLKSRVAAKYLAQTLRRHRPRYIEDWIDQATGKALGVDENDLWMCALAKERDLVLVTADGKMQRIADADSDVRLLIV